MNHHPLPTATNERPQYTERAPEDYFDLLDAEVRASLTDRQREAVIHLLGAAIARPAPKLVDLRFWLDLFAYRFYVVLFVGKDRRRRDRPEFAEPTARKGNAAVALMLLIGINLLIGMFILLLAYAIKAAIGYSFLPTSHVAGQLHGMN